MSSGLKQQLNKAKDKATYYVNRAQSKIDETASAIKKQYQNSDIKVKVDHLKHDIEKEVKKVQPYWNRNRDCILATSGLTFGALLVMLSTRV